MLYQSSKGAVEIGTMPLTYAKNALNKLNRSEPGRMAEIKALQDHVEKLTAEAEASDANPRAVMGGNNPPADEPAPKLEGREAIDSHVSDLLTEASNWADGVALETQGQADDVGRLLGQLRQAVGLVDDQATKEKAPHNEAVNEIGAWQNGYVARGLKKTPDGSLTKAIAATGNLSAAWLRKMDDERRAREKVAAEVAQKAAQDAIAARAEARETTDLEVMGRADDLLANAEALIRDAKGIAKEKVNVGGGDGLRAVSLRSVWRAEVTNYAAAYGHYKQKSEFMAEFHALIQKWADRDSRIEAVRLVGAPGVSFIEDRVV